ncbi:unnamed protein product [Polarella glacialis]|uniref:Protein kinase domain-containing protein n=1 Tax=Polarella glacialis TaxID=89957 RepID=A0A813H0I6_POLGL|nr:unnamed protein product [Polarella glacialis]
MELVRGGELFDAIVKNRTLNEIEAKHIFRQLLDGVGYMHAKHVIHRDLKPENILIDSSRELKPPLTGNLHDVKIADFGLSKITSEGTSFAKTFVGTPQYWAPEVLNVQRGGGSYTQAADFWSLGAVLYVMLGGKYPFDGKKMPLEEQIRTAAYTMTAPAWQRVSEEAKDMVRGLLKVDPVERFNLEDCMIHPWMAGGNVPIPMSEGRQLMVTEVVSDSQAPGTRPVPVVTQPSNVSDISDRVESVPNSASSQPPNKAGSASPESSEQGAGMQVHSVNVGPSAAAQKEQETIFCLNELLKLQVSIAGSLEMACLAFRHTDAELADAIRRTFRQARDLSSHAANIVSKYAQVAQQVSQTVLPDLELAIQEKEPSLAVSLLGMVKDWVSNMKKDGEEIQQKYVCLHESVHNLIVRAQHVKTNADLRLGEALQAELPKSLSPRSQHRFLASQHQVLALGQGDPVRSDSRDEERGNSASSSPQKDRAASDCSASAPPAQLFPGGSTTSPSPVQLHPVDPDFEVGGSSPSSARADREGHASAKQAQGQKEWSSDSRGYPSRDGTAESKVAVNVPGTMSLYTRHLFEQLSQAKGRGTDDPMDGAGLSGSGGGGQQSAEAWKRDVLDLLFMAPGVGPAQLPKMERFDFTAAAQDFVPTTEASEVSSPVGGRGRVGTADEADDVTMANGVPEDEMGDVRSSSPGPVRAEDMLVRYVPGASSAQVPGASSAQSTLALTHSPASLLRALRELKRVDEILQGCSTFWANMDGTVQKLAQMKEHTEVLVNFASSSKALRERFEQRLGEYSNFWSSLEKLCRQYCVDHQASSKRMYEVIREVADAADVIDTAQSARLGIALAMTGRHSVRGGYAA